MLPPSRKKTAALGLLLALLLWRGVVGVWDLVGELGRSLPDVAAAVNATEDERIARGLAEWERREQLPTGLEFALFQALREHVREDGNVFLLCAKQTRKRFLAFTHMNVLLFPRHFHLTQALPDYWKAVAKDLGERCYILEYDQPSDPQLAEACVELARGKDFVLWQYRVER